MTIIYIVLLVIVWLGCEYAGRCLTLGHFTERFPDHDHSKFANPLIFAGIGTLLISLFSTPRRWMWHPYTTEQRWREFQRLYPALANSPKFGRAYFDAPDDEQIRWGMTHAKI